jgi:hypothetical protein
MSLVEERSENYSFEVPTNFVTDILKEKLTVPLFPNEFVVLTKSSNPNENVILANDTPYENPLTYMGTNRIEEHVNLNDIAKITEAHQQSKDLKEKEFFERNQNRPIHLRFLSPRSFSAWNVTARSKEQAIALEILQNPDIKLVTLVGQVRNTHIIIITSSSSSLLKTTFISCKINILNALYFRPEQGRLC